MKRLALFDLDETLIAGDSDYLWGQTLIEVGVVDRATYESRNQEFYEKYRSGVLNLSDFLEFQLKPLANRSRSQLDTWHAQFMAEKILPIIRPGTRPLIASHRDALKVIITATNRFVTEPIAAALGIDNLIATELEMADGFFTGRGRGTLCFREGKVKRLDEWLAARGERLADFGESWFYTDSINDLPLLEKVTNPVVVHPDPRLSAHAISNNWPRLSLD